MHQYVIAHTKLPPSPVILWIELDGKPKWLPLSFGYHDVMRTAPQVHPHGHCAHGYKDHRDNTFAHIGTSSWTGLHTSLSVSSHTFASSTVSSCLAGRFLFVSVALLTYHLQIHFHFFSVHVCVNCPWWTNCTFFCRLLSWRWSFCLTLPTRWLGLRQSVWRESKTSLRYVSLCLCD